MNFKSIFLILICANVFQSCKQDTAKDYAGTYVGMIRDKKISMFLKAGENESITGTIFDRANNFNVKGSIEKGKFIGQAKDTLLNSLFEVEGYHHKDTLVFLLSMVRPQISPPLPIKNQKVFISSSANAPASSEIKKDTSKPEKIVKNVNKGNTAMDRHDPAVVGLWEIKEYSKGKVPTIISGNKYLFFNVNGSLSYLDGELKPLKDKAWYTEEGHLFFITTKSGEYPEKVGNYTADNKVMNIIGQGGSKINMIKKN